MVLLLHLVDGIHKTGWVYKTLKYGVQLFKDGLGGSDVFGQYRSYYGLLTVSFRNYCFYDLEQNYEDWIGNDVKPNLDAVILAGGRF